jgi:sugar lactone lactonase YvrE
MRGAFCLVAAAACAVALPVCAPAAEILQATVQRVDGAAVDVDAGSASGVKVGARFQVISQGKVIRIPLTGTVTYQEGRPFAVLKVVEVGERVSRCLVESVEEGENIATGLGAIMVPPASTSRETPPAAGALVPAVAPLTPVPAAVPVETAKTDAPAAALGTLAPAPASQLPAGPSTLQAPQGMGISADPGKAQPGQKVRLAVNGIDPKEIGYRVGWKVSGGWLSAAETATPSVTWIAPRSAGKHEIEITVTLPGGKAYQGRGLIEVAGAPLLAERIELEKVFGYNAYAGEPLRIGDVAFDAQGGMYILDTRLKCVYRMEQGGKLTNVASRKVFGEALVREPVALTVHDGKCYVLDLATPFVKVFQDDKLASTMGDNVPVGQATDVAVDSRGQTYIVDRAKQCFHVFDARGYYLHPRGRRGKSLGEFLNPVAIATSPKGNLLVLDAARRDVQIFDPNYRVVAKRDLRVQPGNELLDVEVAPDDKSFYVLEGPRAAVARYSDTGDLLFYSAQDESRFPALPASPTRFAVDGLGRIHVVPRSREGIFRYTPEGRADGSFATERPGSPLGIAVDHQGNFTVIDEKSPHVRLYDAEGWLVSRFGEVTDTPVPYRPPQRVSMLRSKMMPVTLGDTARGAFDAPVEISSINVFDRHGDRIRSVGTRGTGSGQFTRPTDLDTDRDGNIYVLDRDQLKVAVYSSEGAGTTPERERTFSRGSRLAHELAVPNALAIDSETGDMYVFDAKLRTVKKFNRDAIHMANLGADTGLVDVERMRVDHLGFLWVLDRKLQELRRIDFREKTGTSTLSIPLRQLAPDAIDFGLDASGRVYILSSRDLVYQFR